MSRARVARLYRFVCRACGLAEERMAKCEPHVCMDCKRTAYKRSNEKFNKLEADARAAARKKREQSKSGDSNAVNQLIHEMERKGRAWASSFEE